MGQLIEALLSSSGWAALALLFMLPALEAPAFLGLGPRPSDPGRPRSPRAAPTGPGWGRSPGRPAGADDPGRGRGRRADRPPCGELPPRPTARPPRSAPSS